MRSGLADFMWALCVCDNLCRAFTMGWTKEILKAGSGAKPTAGRKVTVRVLRPPATDDQVAATTSPRCRLTYHITTARCRSIAQVRDRARCQQRVARQQHRSEASPHDSQRLRGSTLITRCSGAVGGAGIVQATNKKFWSTKDPGQTTFSFNIGLGQVRRCPRVG